MNTLKIIEGQKEDFEDKFVEHKGRYRLPYINNRGQLNPNLILDWHKQSIKQILEAEVERKRGMKIKYSNENDHYVNHEIGDIKNKMIEEDIEHLSVLLDSLK